MTPRKKRPSASGPGAGSAEVFSFAEHAARRDNPVREASAYVANARAALGMAHAEFAQYLSALLPYNVTAGAIEHYESDAPPGEVLIICQRITGIITESPVEGPGGDRVRPYAGRGQISRAQWNEIISGSTDHLWLYGMAEHGYAADDAVPAILKAAAESGCGVRVLLLDPECPAAAKVDADEASPPGTLPARIRGALAKFSAMRADCPAIEIRLYDTYPTLSIVRGDGEMLVTPYLRYVMGGNSPTFAITEDSAPGLFGCWERHFYKIWDNSRGHG